MSRPWTCSPAPPCRSATYGRCDAAARRLRARDSGEADPARAQVIIISGAIDLEAPAFVRLRECFEVRDAIEKPFEPALILTRVRQSIGHPAGL